jgi:hypothetical protein
MADDADFIRRLPKWPDAAGELPVKEQEPERDGSDGDLWLVLAGVLYPLVGFGVLLLGGGTMGPLAFSPLAVPLPAFLLVASVIGFRVQGVRLRWGSVAAFVGWVLLMAYAQWSVYAATGASV